MPEDGRVAATLFAQHEKTEKAEPRKAPLAALGSVEELLAKYRGDPVAIKAGIYSAVMGSVALTSALSMIPMQSNFASVFAGSVLRDLTSPGINKAITGPIGDYLDNIFPTGELNVRMLVTGIERGALTDEEVIDTAVDSGIKDKEILKLLKIAKICRFDRETRDDYSMLDRYQDAVISAQIAAARQEIDEAIADRQALIKEYQRIEREQAMEEAAA